MLPVDVNAALRGDRVDGKKREPIPFRSYTAFLQFDERRQHIREGLHRIPYKGEVEFQGCRIIGWEGRNHERAGDIPDRPKLRGSFKPDRLKEIGIWTAGMKDTIGTLSTSGDTTYPFQLRPEGSPKDKSGVTRDMKPILRLEGEPVD